MALSRKIREHVRSNVVGYIALFGFAMSGTASALSGSGTVDHDDLQAHVVHTEKVHDAAVTRPKLATNAVNSAKVVNGSIIGADVNEGQLDATPLATRVAQGGCGEAVAGTGEMVKVGPTCIDRYEASVWSSPTGGTQYGVSSDNYPCNDNGQNCDNIYARSVAGVQPSTRITYFQAQQALANSGKRLPTNAEWQAAVAGTPENQCNDDLGEKGTIGVFSSCVSRFGALDMVGNVWEWVADWDEEATETCGTWPASYSSDATCIGRGSQEPSTRFPGALARGGYYNGGTSVGPFAVAAAFQPSDSLNNLGFRGAR